MSTYTSGRGRVRTRPRMTDLVRQACDLVEREGNLLVDVANDFEPVSSRTFDHIAERTFQLGAASTISGAKVALHLLEQDPVAAAVFDLAQPGLRSTIEGLIDTACHPTAGIATTSTLGMHAFDLVQEGIAATVTELRVGERTTSFEAIAAGLSARGYELEVHHGEATSAVYATIDDVAVGVLVEDGGTVDVDFLGCGGGACVQPLEELVDAIEAEGLELELTRTVVHGDDRGGPMLTRAGAMACRTMAEGLVAQREQRIRSTRAQAAATRAQRLRVIR